MDAITVNYREEEVDSPYISCSSIGSKSSSSSPDSSESEEGGENGSGRKAEGGTILAKRPFRIFDDCVLPCRRRLGKSDAFRIVGLALSISDMVFSSRESSVREAVELWQYGGSRVVIE